MVDIQSAAAEIIRGKKRKKMDGWMDGWMDGQIDR